MNALQIDSACHQENAQIPLPYEYSKSHNLPAVLYAKCLNLNEQVLDVNEVILNETLQENANKSYHTHLAILVRNVST